jgi:chromosome segregation ATPase
MTARDTGGPNVSWLDEELRREKTIVEELRDLVDRQQVALVDQAQRLISLEDRLTRVQNQQQAIPEIRQLVQNSRDEMVAMLGDLKQDLQKRETEQMRSRQGERERDSRALEEIRGELVRFGPLEQAVTVGRAEDRRINEGLHRLQQQIEIVSKQMPQFEEARRLLADAIAKNVVSISKVAEEVDEFRAGRNALSQRILPLESEISKLAQQIGDLQNMRQEITAQQKELVERQRRTDRERAQTMAEWGRKLDAMDHQIDAWADQLRFFTDQHEKNRRVLRDVQTLAQDLSQQQDRLRQLHQIAEEQLRRELREGRTENDHRWAQELERREQSRQEREIAEDQQNERLTSLEEGLADLVREMAAADLRAREIVARMDAEGQESRQMMRSMMQTTSKELHSLISTWAETYGMQE